MLAKERGANDNAGLQLAAIIKVRVTSVSSNPAFDTS